MESTRGMIYAYVAVPRTKLDNFCRIKIGKSNKHYGVYIFDLCFCAMVDRYKECEEDILGQLESDSDFQFCSEKIFDCDNVKKFQRILLSTCSRYDNTNTNRVMESTPPSPILEDVERLFSLTNDDKDKIFSRDVKTFITSKIDDPNKRVDIMKYIRSKYPLKNVRIGNEVCKGFRGIKILR